MQSRMFTQLQEAVGGGEKSFVQQLADLTSEGSRFPDELRAGPTPVSLNELAHATTGGNGHAMAMANRGYEFHHPPPGPAGLQRLQGDSGALGAAGTRLRVIDGGGSTYWGKALGHGGWADAGHFTWAEDHALVEVTFPGCAPFQVRATAGVKATDLEDATDDHWWTPASPRTAFRVHRMRHQQDDIGDFDALPTIAPRVMADAQARYRDFDGRGSTVSPRTRITQVFTRVRDMRVQCAQEDKLEFDVPRGRRPAMRAPRPGDWGYYPPGQDTRSPTDSVLDGIYENLGGINCAAETHLEGLPTLPTTFLEGRGRILRGEACRAAEHEGLRGGPGRGRSLPGALRHPPR